MKMCPYFMSVPDVVPWSALTLLSSSTPDPHDTGTVGVLVLMTAVVDCLRFWGDRVLCLRILGLHAIHTFSKDQVLRAQKTSSSRPKSKKILEGQLVQYSGLYRTPAGQHSDTWGGIMAQPPVL